MEIEKLQSAIEAILFTMGDSVEISKLAFAIGHDEETTKKLVRNMMEESVLLSWKILFSYVQKRKCTNI
mgnify:CR=1 FL=1